LRRYLTICNFGYETSVGKDDPRDIVAQHSSKANISIRVFPKAVRFSTHYRFNEQSENLRLECLEYTNSLNLESIATQYTMIDNFLFVQLWMFAAYEKVGYAEFLGVWNDDIDKLRNHKDTLKFLK